MFKVIIAGSRDFNNYELLKVTMDKLLVNIEDSIVIVSGEAIGADRLGKQYAVEKGYSVKSFPADWKNKGKSAGYLRNIEMARYADAVVCFWDGKSKGTQHMINIAKEYNLKLRVKTY